MMTPARQSFRLQASQANTGNNLCVALQDRATNNFAATSGGDGIGAPYAFSMASSMAW